MNASRDIEQILGTIDQLPTVPSVLHEILSLTQRERSSANDLVKVIARDQSLTANLLRIANSPVFGMPYRVQSARQAVVLLGFNEVRNLALSVSVFAGFPASSQGARFDRGAFWRHAALVGDLTRDLFARYSDPDAKTLYYTAGLLHDIGVVVLDRFFPAVFAEIADTIARENLAPAAAETRHLGVAHGLIGARLLRRWQLPGELVEAVETMSAPWQALRPSPLAMALFYANLLAELLGYPAFDQAPPLTANDFFASRDAERLEEAGWLWSRDELDAALMRLRADPEKLARAANAAVSF